MTTSSSILISSIPRLYKLAELPIVIHVTLEPAEYPDFSGITSIRNTGFIFLQSHTLEDVQDTALTAHALALKAGRGVIHFFPSEPLPVESPIAIEDKELVKRLLDISVARRHQHSAKEPLPLYADRERPVSAETAPTTLSSDEAGGKVVNGTSANGSETVLSHSSDKQSTNGNHIANGDTHSSADTLPASKPATTEEVLDHLSNIWSTIADVTTRTYEPFEYQGPKNAESVIFIFGPDPGLFVDEIAAAASSDQFVNVGVITARLYRPWVGHELSAVLPKSVKRIAVLEPVRRKTTKWGPLLLDFLMTLKSGGLSSPTIVGYQLGYIEESTIKQALRGIFQNLLLETPIQNLEIGLSEAPKPVSTQPKTKAPALENAYMKILRQLFGDRLYIANQLGSSHAGISSDISSSPEYGFGSLLARSERKERFVTHVKGIARSKEFVTNAPHKWLSNWLLAAGDADKASQVAPELIARLQTDGSKLASDLLEQKSFLQKESQWLIGSDAWAYDLGNSGVHHVLASDRNINMLIIDSQPYSQQSSSNSLRRKKDIGLYAMNFGNAYVASTAIYSSYTQVLQAMMEAEKFAGPSVVMAYLPYFKEDDSPITVLQETKTAVESGYWPLYRWNPHAENNGEERFSLDSTQIRRELEEFLRRDNYLTQLMRRSPEFSPNLSGSYGSEVRDQQKRRAKDAYDQLLEGLTGAPITILFSSDNGNGESLAKRLGNRSKARGLKVTVMSMDNYPMEDLSSEENVVFITSTAGQGEFPQNGRAFWDAIRQSTDIDLATVRFAVFSLGDSHYWPRKEDKLYYNKPGKDLQARLLTLGAKDLTGIGLGDDQDPDTYQTGYQEWEPKLWQALGVDDVEGLPEEPPPITNEDIKIESNFLRGTIKEGLEDPSTGAISASDQQLTKFHGTYMQDDRDLRDQRKAQGLEPAYSFMIRCRLPGGVATPKQWIHMDAISSHLGNDTMKLTTRQTFQFHGVIKKKLRPAMQAINKALMTTIAACGDVNRNVMCSTLPTKSKYHDEVMVVVQKISDHLLPSTTAYHEILALRREQ